MSSLGVSNYQIDEFSRSVELGLSGLYKALPRTGSEWADENFYLSSESSYQEGKWKTLPFQVAILNAMCNDAIRTVNVVKSARLGYTKMLLAAEGYLIEHKKRNVFHLAADDKAAARYMKSQFEAGIRDIPIWAKLAPWLGRKHRDSSILSKLFANGKQFYCHGGRAAANYRELSVDAVIYDELAAFDQDIEGEGSPTFLGDKRLEGSIFGKSIRGSTPKLAGSCQIEASANESPVKLRFYVKCPHCGGEQTLKFGGKETQFGLKWIGKDPKTAYYCCEHNGCTIKQHELQQEGGRYICDETGIWTRDGIDWYDSEDEITETPESISFYVWTIFSPFTTWVQIVKDFFKTFGNISKLKSFVNTTLGETWQDEAAELLDWEVLKNRRERYGAQVPDEVCYITGGIDTQDDRLEFYVWGWGEDETAYLLWKYILWGDTAKPGIWESAKEIINETRFKYADGTTVECSRWAWDSGGHRTSEVYAVSRSLGIRRVVPVKGHSKAGKPVAEFPRKRNKDRVHLTMVGTDTAKDILVARLKDGEMIRLPLDDEVCGDDECKQLVSERRIWKIVSRKRVNAWDNEGRRNEALDCLVYAYAALRVSLDHFNIKLKPREKQAKSVGIGDLAKQLNGG